MVAAPGFTREESAALVRSLEQHYDLLLGDRKRTTKFEERERLWEEIAAAVNAVSHIGKTAYQCRKRVSDIRRGIQRKLARLEARKASVQDDSDHEASGPSSRKGHGQKAHAQGAQMQQFLRLRPIVFLGYERNFARIDMPGVILPPVVRLSSSSSQHRLVSPAPHRLCESGLSSSSPDSDVSSLAHNYETASSEVDSSSKGEGMATRHEDKALVSEGTHSSLSACSAPGSGDTSSSDSKICIIKTEAEGSSSSTTDNAIDASIPEDQAPGSGLPIETAAPISDTSKVTGPLKDEAATSSSVPAPAGRPEETSAPSNGGSETNHMMDSLFLHRFEQYQNLVLQHLSGVNARLDILMAGVNYRLDGVIEAAVYQGNALMALVEELREARQAASRHEAPESSSGSSSGHGTPPEARKLIL